MTNFNGQQRLSCDISVVVPTYNRAHLLLKTLDSLATQTAGTVRYEVIVVDNNSADSTRAAVEQYSKGRPGLRYIFEPSRGVSHARNAGIAAAEADIIAFIDDDVEAAPDWVRTIKQTLDAHPEIDCIGGRIDARWVAPPPAWLTPHFWGAIALQGERGDTPLVDADHACRCLMTANFACRRAALIAVGGFSADYLRDEDRELQLRLWAAGKRGMYVDDVVVSTEVPAERLTKAYHRSFFLRCGESHARMRYLDRIDRTGRLAPIAPDVPTFCGTPGFIFRNAFRHALGLVRSAVTLDSRGAFFHETRLSYFLSYAWTRYGDTGVTVTRIPLEVLRFARAVLRNRRRMREEKFNVPTAASSL